MVSKKSKAGVRLTDLSAYGDDEAEEVNVIIETPQGSRNKFNYEEELGLFKLGGVLPAGASFPFDFGFIPSTLGGDDDPLDVLVLMDEPAFTGCLVATRLIGVIEAEQVERDGEQVRNDRLIGVAAKARNHRDIKTIDEINEHLLDEIEHFFVSYNTIKGKEFKPQGRHGPDRAHAFVLEAMERFRRAHSNKKRKSRKPQKKRKR